MNPFQEYAGQGQAAFVRGDFAQSELLFREALVHKPQSIGALRGLGLALIRQKKFRDAEPVWLKAIAIDPQSAENHHILSSVYFALGKHAATKTHLMRALEIQPSLVDAAIMLAHICHGERDYAAAARHYLHAHDQDPHNIDAFKGAVQALMDSRAPADAIAVGLKGIERLRLRPDIKPADYAAIYMMMADAHKFLGETQKALECYRIVIADNPQNAIARHLLAALEGRLTHDHAQGFAREVFDSMASSFERRLVEVLKYRSPELLAAGLREVCPDVIGFEAAFDLGCGTGLMARALREKFEVRRIVGVDLSPNMIREAEKGEVYAELVCDDVTTAMAARQDRFDVILAADVFIYVGELSRIFALAKALLNPGGFFAFTTEIGAGDVELAAQGHYRHGAAYLARLAADTGFAVVRTSEAPIRRERGEDVMGHYVYLRA